MVVNGSAVFHKDPPVRNAFLALEGVASPLEVLFGEAGECIINFPLAERRVNDQGHCRAWRDLSRVTMRCSLRILSVLGPPGRLFDGRYQPFR